MSGFGTVGRITLTKAQSDSAYGRRLIEQIMAISHDGEITIEEVWQLHAILKEGPADLAAVVFLRSITTGILTDGLLNPAELYELRRGMERVVPKSVRVRLTELLDRIGMPSTFETEAAPQASRDWRSDPATDRQVEYIIALGGRPRDGMTKGEASEVIDGLLVARPPTPRQRMLLRFYDRLDLETYTKEQVSVWVDSLYAQRPDYERAWHLYKVEVNHDNRSTDYMSVPVGAYIRYLRPHRAKGNARAEQSPARGPLIKRLLAWMQFSQR